MKTFFKKLVNKYKSWNEDRKQKRWYQDLLRSYEQGEGPLGNQPLVDNKIGLELVHEQEYDFFDKDEKIKLSRFLDQMRGKPRQTSAL